MRARLTSSGAQKTRRRASSKPEIAFSEERRAREEGVDRTAKSVAFRREERVVHVEMLRMSSTERAAVRRRAERDIGEVLVGGWERRRGRSGGGGSDGRGSEGGRRRWKGGMEGRRKRQECRERTGKCSLRGTC